MIGFGEKVTAAMGGKTSVLCVRSDVARKFYAPFSIQLHDIDTEEEEMAFERMSKVSGDLKKLKRGGEFVSSVLDEIESGDHDMLIFGDIGIKLTKKLAEYSPVPVLICRKGGAPFRFLVCTDGSEYSEKGLRLAGEFARILGVEVTVLSAAKTEEERGSAEEAIKKAKDILQNMGVSEVREKLVVGNIVECIQKEEGNYDLTVVGSRDLGKIQRMVFGHVSLHVLENAAGNVLLVK
jgi:nucleotide-binding universal stress UspA family protein